MTENEAIDLDKLIADAKALAKEKDTLARTFRGFKDYGNPKSTITSGAEKAQKEADQYKQVAKLFEELQQYRAIGTVKGYERAIESSIENYNLYREYKAKVQDFEAIGTVEEFKALKEKNETLKALYEDARKEGSHLIARERAKAIDEFAEKLIKHISQMPSGYIGSGNVLIIAEQMKAGGKK